MDANKRNKCSILHVVKEFSRDKYMKFFEAHKEDYMPKSIDILIECPFYIGEGKEFIACEGVIKGTVDKHFFTNRKDKSNFENLVCCRDLGRQCVHYKRVNELYEKGLRV